MTYILNRFAKYIVLAVKGGYEKCCNPSTFFSASMSSVERFLRTNWTDPITVQDVYSKCNVLAQEPIIFATLFLTWNWYRCLVQDKYHPMTRLPSASRFYGKWINLAYFVSAAADRLTDLLARESKELLAFSIASCEGIAWSETKFLRFLHLAGGLNDRQEGWFMAIFVLIKINYV